MKSVAKENEYKADSCPYFKFHIISEKDMGCGYYFK